MHTYTHTHRQQAAPHLPPVCDTRVRQFVVASLKMPHRVRNQHYAAVLSTVSPSVLSVCLAHIELEPHLNTFPFATVATAVLVWFFGTNKLKNKQSVVI